MSSPAPNSPSPSSSDSVIVFGSINVDLVIGVPALPNAGETVLAGGYALKPGGKGANQALAARRGAPKGGRDGQPVRVWMVGRTGNDGFAKVALENLVAAGVDTSGTCGTDEDATGCAAVMVHDASGENQIVVGAAANLRVSAEDHLRPVLAAAAAANSRGRRMLVMQMEVPLQEVIQAIDIASEMAVPVLLNVAPSTFIPPAESLAKLSILVVNEHEARAVAKERFGQETSESSDPRLAGYFLAARLRRQLSW